MHYYTITTRPLYFLITFSFAFNMSETDSFKSPEFDNSSEYDPDQDCASNDEVHYVNERGDRHSEESSSYHISAQADPSSTNNKYVRRIHPVTKKPVRVNFFATNTTPNTIIKHAMTGVFVSDNGRFYKVGTTDEHFLFSVILATGEFGQNAVTLFYDTPEQYERHFFAKVSQSVKDKWYNKRESTIYKSSRAKESSRVDVTVVK